MKKLDVNWSEKLRKACEAQDRLREKASGQRSGVQRYKMAGEKIVIDGCR